MAHSTAAAAVAAAAAAVANVASGEHLNMRFCRTGDADTSGCQAVVAEDPGFMNSGAQGSLPNAHAADAALHSITGTDQVVSADQVGSAEQVGTQGPPATGIASALSNAGASQDAQQVTLTATSTASDILTSAMGVSSDTSSQQEQVQRCNAPLDLQQQ
jgi:hypothetical protein